MKKGFQKIIQLSEHCPFKHYLIYQFDSQQLPQKQLSHLFDLVGEISVQEKSDEDRPLLIDQKRLYLPISEAEPLSLLQLIVQEKELFTFPSEVATAIILQISKAIAYFHAMGFVHGPINANQIYLGLDGKVRLYGWVEGNLSTTVHTPAMDVVSIGLLWESLVTGHRRADPQSQGLDPKIQEIPKCYQELISKALSPHPQDRYSHAGAFLNVLKQGLEESPCFNELQLGRWLSRMLGQRAQDWKALSLTQDPIEAKRISQQLLEKMEQASQFTLPLFEPQAQGDLPRVESRPSQVSLASAQSKPIALSLPVPQFKQAEPMTVQSQSTANQPFTALPLTINTQDQQNQSAVNQGKSSKQQEPKLHIALVWNDTVYYSQVFSPHTKLDLKEENQIPLTPEMRKLGLLPLVGQYDGEWVKLSVSQGFTGYYLNAQHDKKPLSECQGLKVGEAIFLNFGESAIFIKLEEPLLMAQASIIDRLIVAISAFEHQLLAAFAFALCFHLLFIIYGYASISYDKELQDTEISDRFVQILIDTPEKKEIQPEKPKEEELKEEEIKEVKKPEPVQQPQVNQIKDTIKQRAKSKFGEGKSAANALADFLEGKSNASSEEKLSLNDASAALGSGLNSATAGLGAALGAVGGDIALGGGGGGGGALDGLLGAGVAKSGGVGKVKGGSGGGGGIKGQVKAMNSQVKATGGSLSKEEIAKVIQQYSSKISNCYEKALLKNPDISGRLQVEWTIQENGGVSDVKQAYSGITQPELSACILNLFNQMKFPKPQGGSVKVKYPFIFSQR